jgi:hypothetical protein
MVGREAQVTPDIAGRGLLLIMADRIERGEYREEKE